MRPDLQQMLVDQGFRWVQSRYPIHPPVPKGQQPSRQLLESVVDVLPGAQPAVYDSGLIEIPMSPPTDIIAFRVANWTLENYLLSIQLGVEKAIREKLVYVHLFHLGSIAPSDPEFRSIDLLCKLVGDAGDQAKLVTGDQIADSLASS